VETSAWVHVVLKFINDISTVTSGIASAIDRFMIAFGPIALNMSATFALAAFAFGGMREHFVQRKNLISSSTVKPRRKNGRSVHICAPRRACALPTAGRKGVRGKAKVNKRSKSEKR
jgi:hypothetical protein